MKPEPNISLPKWPFYVGDAFLVSVAIAIFLQGDFSNPWTAFWCVLSVTLGAILFVIPFVVEYKDRIKIAQLKSEQDNKEEIHKLESLLSTLFNLSDTTTQHTDKIDRSLLVFESLLKRMESRFRGETKSLQPQAIAQVQPQEEPQPDKPLLDFDEESNPNVDIELELDENFLENNNDKNLPGERATILANIQMGIGSKPFIRGEGGGLSWDKGLPMEYLAIGNWQWTSKKTEALIQFQIYKNDEIPASEEPLSISPGEQQEIHPTFEAS